MGKHLKDGLLLLFDEMRFRCISNFSALFLLEKSFYSYGTFDFDTEAEYIISVNTDAEHQDQTFRKFRKETLAVDFTSLTVKSIKMHDGDNKLSQKQVLTHSVSENSTFANNDYAKTDEFTKLHNNEHHSLRPNFETKQICNLYYNMCKQHLVLEDVAREVSEIISCLMNGIASGGQVHASYLLHRLDTLKLLLVPAAVI